MTLLTPAALVQGCRLGNLSVLFTLLWREENRADHRISTHLFR